MSDEFFTDDEVVTLTKASTRENQIEVLTRAKIPFTLNRAGWPVVSRYVYRLKQLGFKPEKTIAAQSEWQPDMSRLNA